MRAITGWRFLLSIALPLVLASLGAMGLAYDLLRRVETSGNEAEHSRNKTVIMEALQSQQAELGRLVTENARWDEAAIQTADVVDKQWFQGTWGNTISVGKSYDVVAVVDAATGRLLAYNGKDLAQKPDASAVLGDTFESVKESLPVEQGIGLVTGYTSTAAGASIVAVAPVTSPSQNNRSNGKYLVFSRSLSPAYLASLEKSLLIRNVHISSVEAAEVTGLTLNDLSGKPVLGVAWRDRNLGAIVTGSSWGKASAVLAFLVMVMTMIAWVCWRLVQQLVANENKALHDAHSDHLTGLPNRLALTRELKALEAAGDVNFALAFADLDGFKEVNDSYGHEYGDRLIVMVAAGIMRLAAHARFYCRMGGDEFIVVFVGETAEAQAKDFANQLIRFLDQPFDMEGRLASVGVSVGIARKESALDDMELLRRTDIAMYRAKNTGRNRWCMFDKSYDDERMENLAIAAELREIIDLGDLDIAFQPVINARSNSITGVEALARWPQTSRRKVTADKFVSIAESFGIVDDLGELILDKACRAAQAWPELRIAVNISAVQLNNPRFVSRSLDIMAANGIAPNRMEFEITETSLIHDTERAKQVFKALQQAGIKVALDDFGTGFSSIGYLRTFSFDRIKIDKSIVSKVLSSPAELAIVQGTLLVARGLSADVTAEGVEREEEVAVLRLAGCTELQGFYYHMPMDGKSLSALLAKSRVTAQPRTQVVA